MPLIEGRYSSLPTISALALRSQPSRKIYDSAKRPLLRRISDIVLAAPDVETSVADRDLLPVRDAFKINTTIYAPETDVMMRISEF